MRGLLADPVIDGGALLKTIWVSLAAGIGVVAAFSIAVLSASHARDRRRDERLAAAVPYWVVLAIALGACGYALYRGYLFVVQKS